MANVYDIHGKQYFKLYLEWNFPLHQSFSIEPALFDTIGYVRFDGNRFFILNDTFPENAGKPDSLSEGSNEFETVLFDLSIDGNHHRKRHIKYNKYFFDKHITVIEKDIIGFERSNKVFHLMNSYFSILVIKGEEEQKEDIFRPEIKIMRFSLKGGFYEIVTNLHNAWGDNCRCNERHY
ncbi:MAG: hypothetical protein K1X92_15745 [Bacteroidia bacterium]|nr:hypothetical protein [Bacteroidia bacterium]